MLSEWQLQLPADPSQGESTQFDYNTISDVVLHIRYTARDGGEPLRKAAVQHVTDLIDSAYAAGSTRLFSMRHEFPAEWVRSRSQTPEVGEHYKLAITLRPEHYPFWSQAQLNSVERVDLFAQSTEDPVPTNLEVADQVSPGESAERTDMLTRSPSLNNLLLGSLANVAPLAQPTGALQLYFDTSELSNLWIAVQWSGR